MRAFQAKLIRLSMITASVAAMTAMATPALAQATVRQFDIPAQPLSSALLEFSKQSDVMVVISPEAANGKRAPAVRGSLPVNEAIGRLLRGSGLRAVPNPRGGYRIERIVAAVPNLARSAPQVAASSENPQRVGAAMADEEIVVTAQKREERLRDVPVPVTALVASELATQNRTRIQDYYTSVPGLSLSPTANNQSLGVRGISTGGVTNPTVGIVIDDVPFGSSTGLGGGQVVPDIDPGDLQRIEVLRGPQGTLYGASSVGGLLKFVTVDPSTEAVSGRLQVGVFGIRNSDTAGFEARGSVNVPLTDTFAIRVSGFRRSEPGYIDNPVRGLRGVNDVDVAGGRISALWRPDERITLRLAAMIQDTDGAGSNDIHKNVGRDLAQNYLPNTGWFHRRAELYNGTLTVDLGRAKLVAITGYNVNGHSNSLDYERPLGSLIAPLFGTTATDLRSYNRTRKFTQEVRLETSVGSSLDLLAGAYYTRENSRTVQNVFAIDADGNERGEAAELTFLPTLREFALFGDLTVHLSDRFDIQVGARQSFLRQSIEQSVTGPLTPLFAQGRPSPALYPEVRVKTDAFTYLVTPRLRLSDDIMAYARLASGYRAGGANLSPGGVAPAGYNPDRTYNYEVGIKGDLLDRLVSFDASIYHIDWRNIQLSAINPTTRVSYTFNGGRAKSAGVEFSLDIRPTKGLTISGFVAYNDAALTENFPVGSVVGVDGDRLPNSAKWSSNLSANFEFDVGANARAFLGATIAYVGDRKGLFRNVTVRETFPDYTKIDLRAGVRSGPWAATVYADNLTDRRALLYGGLGTTYTFSYTAIRPRTVGLSLARTF